MMLLSPLANQRAVILGDTAEAHHHGCELVMENLVTGLAEQGIATAFRHSGKHWRSVPQLCQALTQADLLVINGEGSIHHDRPLGYELIEAAEYAHQQGVPAYLINCTWQANSRLLAERAAVFRRIYVRESLSAVELAEAGIATTITPDLTLATRCPPPSAERRGWLVTDSTIPAITTQLYRLARQLGDAQYAPLISSQWNRGSWVRTAKRWAQRELGRRLGPLGWCPASYASLAHADQNARAFLTRLSRCQAILTGRFHATCFAILTGTPVLAVKSNSSKIEGLLNDAGLSPDRLIPSSASPAEVQQRLTTAAWTPTEERHRCRYIEQARAAIGEMFSTISADGESAANHHAA
ncbi:MAG: polysaccharide pyruvyl transferase family protein [Planctomycetota bacterium]|nr:MAG: polysaccharide pyruvyl transferase family protein [Planctomycetota bacterium]